MSSFNNVNVTKKANVYFDGRVTSRTITFSDNSVKTLGIMMPGEYEFGTDKAEIMEIYSGEMKVLLPGSSEWISVCGGESFNVPAKSRFNVNVAVLSDYCCSFID